MQNSKFNTVASLERVKLALAVSDGSTHEVLDDKALKLYGLDATVIASELRARGFLDARRFSLL